MQGQPARLSLFIMLSGTNEKSEAILIVESKNPYRGCTLWLDECQYASRILKSRKLFPVGPISIASPSAWKKG